MRVSLCRLRRVAWQGRVRSFATVPPPTGPGTGKQWRSRAASFDVDKSIDVHHDIDLTSTTPKLVPKLMVVKAHTTGLPMNANAYVEDTANWPRLVSLSWKLWTSKQTLMEDRSMIVKPSNFEIPEETIKFHGISTQTALEKGVDIAQVCDAFVNDLDDATYIVGHNLHFDYQIVRCELVRLQRQYSFRHVTPLSLMELTQKLMGLNFPSETPAFNPLPGMNTEIRSGNYKPPTLAELYKHLFHADMELRHDNHVDVTSKIFFQLVQNGHISPKKERISREERLQKLYI